MLLLIAGVLYFNGHRTAGIVLAIVAGLTDYLDGAIARATGTGHAAGRDPGPVL